MVLWLCLSSRGRAISENDGLGGEKNKPLEKRPLLESRGASFGEGEDVAFFCHFFVSQLVLFAIFALSFLD